MRIDLTERVALVTGATGELGRVMARTLAGAARGWRSTTTTRRTAQPPCQRSFPVRASSRRMRQKR